MRGKKVTFPSFPGRGGGGGGERGGYSRFSSERKKGNISIIPGGGGGGGRKGWVLPYVMESRCLPLDRAWFFRCSVPK